MATGVAAPGRRGVGRIGAAPGGAGAGLAAAYNAPISGALFVSEIILGGTAMESFGPLVVASVVSSATVHRFLGYSPVYDVPKVQFASNWELIFYVVLGAQTNNELIESP